MGLIKNFDELAITPERKIILEVIEAGLASIQPDNVVSNHIKLEDKTLTLLDKTFDLSQFERVFLLGFGKGSAGISKIVESKLGSHLKEGYVIDTTPETFSKIEFTQGTHPLPSEENYRFTAHIAQKLANLTEKDLVLIVICGGGSAMLVAPNENVTLQQKIDVNKALLTSGATIHEMNMVRKHLSKIKGGGLAKILYPAHVASLIFSDVPGNDLNVIASGPTVKDPTTIDDAINVLKKYKLVSKVPIKTSSFIETPKEDKYFEHVQNILMVSNVTALEAMDKKAQELGYKSFIYSDKFQGEAKHVGEELIHVTGPHQILLAGGETTVTVTGKGKGGRNQVVVLGQVASLDERTIIVSIDSDGWDNTSHAGAIGDSNTVKKAQELGLNIQDFIQKDSSFNFFEKVKDGIITDRLPSNVADLLLVLRQ